MSVRSSTDKVDTTWAFSPEEFNLLDEAATATTKKVRFTPVFPTKKSDYSRTAPGDDSDKPGPAPIKKRDVENISPKELSNLFTADITKASKASSFKHALWKTAAITLLVAYSAIVLAAVVVTGIFASPFALPLVALAGLGLIYPVLKLYDWLNKKAIASKAIADEDKGILNELEKLKKLSHAEFTQKYGHLFNLGKSPNKELQNLLAEKGVDFYKPIIARLNYYQNQIDKCEKDKKDLLKNYLDDKDKIEASNAKKETKEKNTDSLGRDYWNDKQRIENSLCEAKMSTAFILALLEEPWSFKNKELTDICKLNRLDFAHSKLALALNAEEAAKKSVDEDTKKSDSDEPSANEAFKVPFNFAVFKDEKIKPLHQMQIQAMSVKALANHILKY